MLTIHDKVPTDMEYVKDNERYFREVTYSKVETNALPFISKLDKGTELVGFRYIDRQGRPSSIMDLSTGCKTLLNIFYNPSVCFDLIECGPNAAGYALSLEEGHVYYGACTLFGEITNNYWCWEGRGVVSGLPELLYISREVWSDD